MGLEDRRMRGVEHWSVQDVPEVGGVGSGPESRGGVGARAEEEGKWWGPAGAAVGSPSSERRSTGVLEDIPAMLVEGERT